MRIQTQLNLAVAEAVFKHNLGETMSYIRDADEFLQKKNNANKKAGYPPNCNEGYVEKEGKCVSAKEESEAGYLYENVKTGEVFTYTRKGGHRKGGTLLIYRGKA